MKSILIVLLFVCNGYSQQVPLNMNDSEKMMYYMAERKSPALGVVFEILLPTSGYAYSGNFKRGLIRFGTTFIPVLMGVMISKDGVLSEKCINWSDECEWRNGVYYRDDESKMELGYALAVYGYTVMVIINWFDVAKNVRAYNNKLYNKIYGTKGNSNINTTLYPQKNGLSLQLSYNF